MEANLEETTRDATIAAAPSNGGMSQAIRITQDGIITSFNSETYHYKLPVIFHVFYHDKDDKDQYVEVRRLSEILKGMSELYQNARANSASMNLEFVLIAEDPKGKTLSEPGVERIEQNATAIDVNDFVFSNDQTYNCLVWEPNDYINMMVYRFTGADIMGVSHFPYSPTKNPLSGIKADPRSLIRDSLGYAYCVSISNFYIHEEFATTVPNQSDMAAALVHGLRYYLGLYHVFSESEEDDADVCADTDYCIDTYTYDRKAYKTQVETLVEQNGPISFENLARRHDCVRNIDFTSRDIMGYTYSCLNEFTAQQRARVRHILTYSLLVPGPKKGSTDTRATYDGPLDLPVHMMK